MVKISVDALQAVVSTQQHEIKGLRAKLAEWEACDAGQMKCRIAELETKNADLEERCNDLQAMVATFACLCVVIGTGLIGLIADKVTEFVSQLPKIIDDEKKQELRERLNAQQAELVEAIIQIDTIALKAFEKEYKRIWERVDTLPPLQRVIFEALSRLTKRNSLGSVLLDYLRGEEIFTGILEQPYLKDRMNLIGTLLDFGSNAWPLVAANAFTPLLRFMGVDEAAQAAGESLDLLEQQGKVPRRFLPKIKSDLVKLGAIQEQTRLDTIGDYLATGYQLEILGLSPEQASYRGIDASVSHLKRSQKAYRALVQLYNRMSEDTANEFMEMLEQITNQMSEMINKAVQESTAKSTNTANA